MTDGDCFIARANALVRSYGYVYMADVVLRVCEASCFVDGRAAGAGSLAAAGIAMVLGDDEEPCDAERSGVCGIDYAVEDVETGKGQAMEWRLRSDVGG